MRRPFIWGSYDCATFAARAVQVQVGIDIIARMRELTPYHSHLSAHRLIRKLGLEGATSLVLGDSVSVSKLGRGDVVLISNEGQECLGVLVPPVVLAQGGDGIVGVPVTDALCGWRVRSCPR